MTDRPTAPPGWNRFPGAPDEEVWTAYPSLIADGWETFRRRTDDEGHTPDSRGRAWNRDMFWCRAGDAAPLPANTLPSDWGIDQ